MKMHIQPGGRACFRKSIFDHPMEMKTVRAQSQFGDRCVALVTLPGHAGNDPPIRRFRSEHQFRLASDAGASTGMSLHATPATRRGCGTCTTKSGGLESSGATDLCGHDVQQWAILRKGGHAHD